MTSEAAALARFARDFGVAYLRGERITVGDPLGESGKLALQHGLGLDPTLGDALEELWMQSALETDIAPAPFDEDAGVLLYAVHELFAACHPQADSFYSRAHLYCIAARQAVTRLPRTYDPERLLTRHLMLRSAFTASRRDIHLEWWTGRASFYGDEPPTRLQRWPGIRRVKNSTIRRPIWEIAFVDGDEETRVARIELIQSLLFASPLTQLHLLGEPALQKLGFSLMSTLKKRGKRMSPLFALEDRRIARMVCDDLVDRGADRTGAALALGVLAAVREGKSPHAIRLAIEVCNHLLVIMVLAMAEDQDSRSVEPLRTFLETDAAKLSEPVRLFWSVLKASLAIHGDVLLLPFDALPEPARGLYLDQVLPRFQQEELDQIGQPLARELTRRLPKAILAA